MTPVNVCEVAKVIVQMLEDVDDSEGNDIIVERSEPPNEQPSRCPWIGVYKMGIQYPTITSGMGAGYRRQRMQFALVIQQSHPDSGADCEELLETLVQNSLSALMSDTSLRGRVDVLDEIDVTYQQYGQVDSAYMQTAIVQFVGVTNVSGG